MKTLFCAFLIAAAASAQSNPGAVGGPLLGLVVDPGSAAIRLLTGVPASAMLRGPVDSGAALEHAAVSAQGYAVGTESQSGAAMLISQAGRRPLSGLPTGADLIVLSPRGTAAAFYQKNSRTAFVVSGLPDSPQAPRPVVLERQPMALAVSDDGANLLAVQPVSRVDAAVLLYRGADSPLPLRNSRRFAGVDFIPGSADALIAESNGVLVVSQAFGPQLIAGEGDGIADVTAAAATGDGSRVIIAMRSGQVAVRDRNTNQQVTVTCACRPDVLARLRGSGVFRLNEIGDGPLWLLDTDGETPRVVFVAGERQ